MTRAGAGRIRRSLVGLLLAAALVPLGAAVPSPAAIDVLIRCDAAAGVSIVPDTITGIATWTIAGKGSCAGDLGGTYAVDFAGTGTSFDLGPCTDPQKVLMQALDISMTVSLMSFQTGLTQIILERWTANETTFPIATPFEIVKGNRDIGLGVLFTHIAGQCPPGGVPVGKVFWAQDI
jgi:hypothetical protein